MDLIEDSEAEDPSDAGNGTEAEVGIRITFFGYQRYLMLYAMKQLIVVVYKAKIKLNTLLNTYVGKPFGHAFTIAGIAPPGFYGETLRSDPPDVWLPLQQEPLVAGEGTLLRQPIAASLRVIGRLKAGQTTAGMSARLTGVLRRWLVTESGYPPEWMSEIKRLRRSGPAITRSTASWNSGIPIARLFRRAARIAASFTRLARSAPVKPGVIAATCSRSTWTSTACGCSPWTSPWPEISGSS